MYFSVSLMEMSDWGGTDAEYIKKAIDNIFSINGKIPLEDYTTKLVSVTADGASVNTGHKGGLFTKLERDGNRPWLLKYIVQITELNWLFRVRLMGLTLVKLTDFTLIILAF